MDSRSEPSPPIAKEWTSAPTPSTEDGGQVSPGDVDWLYGKVLERLLELTATLGGPETPSVCAVVRSSPWRVLVGLMRDQDPQRRYGIELPLVGTEGQLVVPGRIVDALREVDLRRDGYERTSHRLHGADVVAGDRAVAFGGHPKPVEDHLHGTVRYLRPPEPEPAAEEVLSLAGFSYHDVSALRLYVRTHRDDAVLGLDVPVPVGGGFLFAELSALFRDGVPRNIADRELPGDPYCDRVFDLRPWFGRG